jgi:hypothetical protein
MSTPADLGTVAHSETAIQTPEDSAAKSILGAGSPDSTSGPSLREVLDQAREQDKRLLKEAEEAAEIEVQSFCKEWQQNHEGKTIPPDVEFSYREATVKREALSRGLLPPPQKQSGKKNGKESEPKPPAYVSGDERAAFAADLQMSSHISHKKGLYFKDESGSLHIIIDGRRIELNFDRENYPLARLFLEGCTIGTTSQIAKATIQRLQVRADQKSPKVRLRKFSFFPDAAEELYVPAAGGNLIKVTADSISEVSNGDNEFDCWLEHPEDAAFKYCPGDPIQGLVQFERLLVETQACRPAMRWFVAMHEALFPYIRDQFAARFIVCHIGPSQHGKTTGAQRFTLLHGLGEVKGDFSVAALANSGDIGLLVLDNKEQANFDQKLIDYCLYLATGAQHGRSSQDGHVRRSGSRPVAVITTIEGVPKQELQKRCVVVDYRLSGGNLSRGDVEGEIRLRRNEISSAMISVLQRYLRIRSERRPTPNPVPNFGEHFAALCDLLRAYGEVTKKRPGWSEELIAAWDVNLRQREEDEDELEHPILRVLQGNGRDQLSTEDIQAVEFRGRKGTLYITECARLLTGLQELRLIDQKFPRTASALGRRLHSGIYRSFIVLDDTKAPDLPMLSRTTNKRRIGIFVLDDTMTDPASNQNPTVMAQVPEKTGDK